jgi:hypothetical protein
MATRPHVIRRAPGARPRSHGNQEKLRPSQATPEMVALSRVPVLIWLRAGPVACLASPPP